MVLMMVLLGDGVNGVDDDVDDAVALLVVVKLVLVVMTMIVLLVVVRLVLVVIVIVVVVIVVLVWRFIEIVLSFLLQYRERTIIATACFDQVRRVPREASEWKTASKRTRQKAAVSLTKRPCAKSHRPTVGVTSARKLDYIDYVALVHDCHKKPAPEVYVDLSQCISSSDGTSSLPVLTTTSEVFSFRHGRLLAGCEHMALMGHNLGEAPVDNSVLRRNSGECMFAGCLAVMLMAFYANEEAPWWQ